jgi:hypothetical protein
MRFGGVMGEGHLKDEDDANQHSEVAPRVKNS